MTVAAEMPGETWAPCSIVSVKPWTSMRPSTRPATRTSSFADSSPLITIDAPTCATLLMYGLLEGEFLAKRGMARDVPTDAPGIPAGFARSALARQTRLLAARQNWA